ncbi:uncharacterized protein LOC141852078 [Brevipalpus obovatus]|uniref:uncharacterized protein LOC141852078 n=1 Tax=Brevipalpus obovatus TaxID=246614 RepID=UPI003D9F0845
MAEKPENVVPISADSIPSAAPVTTCAINHDENVDTHPPNSVKNDIDQQCDRYSSELNTVNGSSNKTDIENSSASKPDSKPDSKPVPSLAEASEEKAQQLEGPLSSSTSSKPSHPLPSPHPPPPPSSTSASSSKDTTESSVNGTKETEPSSTSSSASCKKESGSTNGESQETSASCVNQKDTGLANAVNQSSSSSSVTSVPKDSTDAANGKDQSLTKVATKDTAKPNGKSLSTPSSNATLKEASNITGKDQPPVVSSQKDTGNTSKNKDSTPPVFAKKSTVPSVAIGNGSSTNTTTSLSTTHKNDITSSKIQSKDNVKKRQKRKTVCSVPSNEESESESSEPRASKRIRFQYQPFQSSEALALLTSSYIRSTGSNSSKCTKNNNNRDNEKKILVFNKGDFLAVRNEHADFYVCRAAQNVYKTSRKIKIQWWNDEKEQSLYLPDFYDHIDFESVLTNLKMVKRDREKFFLPNVERKRTTNILERAINVEKGISKAPDPRKVVKDGVDVSIVGKAEEKELIKIGSTI